VTKERLTLAIGDYDHAADLANGRVTPEGIDLTTLVLQIEEIFFRTLTFHEFDVSEMSLAKYVSRLSNGDTGLVAIPVFPSRIHRHSSIYVRRDGPVRAPADLAGRRAGVPEWAQTAAVYSRGMLAHQYGVDLARVDWVQAGVNQPGRQEKVALNLPPGLRLTPAPDRSLSEMLVSGELDAVLSAHAPDCFKERHPNICRLFEDYVAVESAYFEATRIFPIMHTIVIRRERLERTPWIARELLKAFEAAKRRSMARALEVSAPRFPIPWCYAHAERAQAMFGEDYWPYGIEPNRPTLEAFLRYAHEQGVTHRPLTPDEIFAPQTTEAFRV
jgi:4,5-dihydroxyphthalate decarboxylase